jgi:hypothetical protein
MGQPSKVVRAMQPLMRSLKSGSSGSSRSIQKEGKKWGAKK